MKIYLNRNMERSLDNTPLLGRYQVATTRITEEKQNSSVASKVEEEEEEDEAAAAAQLRDDCEIYAGRASDCDEENVRKMVTVKSGWVMRYCGTRKRCCCASCLFLLMTSLLSTLVVLLFVVPAIIQKNLDSSTFRFTSIINMTEPTNNSFILNVGVEIKASSPMSSTLVNGHKGNVENFFFDTTLGQWRRFGTMRLPDIKLKAGDNVLTRVKFNQIVRVSDMAAWADFNVAVIMKDTVDLRFKSKSTALHIRGTWGFLGLVFSGLTLQKDVSLSGADGMKDLRVVSYDAINGPDAHKKYGLDVLPTQIATIETRNIADVSLQPLGVLAMEVRYHSQASV